MSTSQNDNAPETRSAEEIRGDIEQTREEVGDTVEALAAKTDVKAQARQQVQEIKGNVRAKTEQLKAKATSTTPDSGQQALEKVRENPKPWAIGAAVAFAFLVGRRTGRS